MDLKDKIDDSLAEAIIMFTKENNTGLHVYSPGDIIIGGLFPIHLILKRNEILISPVDFYSYSVQMFLRTQGMIYAIEEINQRTPRLLPNITLGYDIYDTCGDVSLAIKATLQLVKNQSELQSCLLPDHINSSLPKPQTKVVIGERYSEVSTAVARILALPSVTQISYASSSEVLSKKFKFPTFFRTVPSDEFQTKAIYELVKEFNWKTVAIVGSDDEYGKYGSNRLQYIFSKSDVCVDFVEILSGDFLESSSDTNEILMDLKDKIDDSLAEAIIMFTKGTFVEAILKAVIENNMNRTWIASDSWSISAKLSTMPGIEKIGQVFGFTFKRNEVPGFRDLVRSMFNGSENDLLEYHLSHYPLCSDDPEEIIECNLSMECSDPKCLAKFVDQDESYSIYLAVQVIAEGLRRLLKCDIHSCERTEFTAFEEIQKVNITVNTTNLYFRDGDPSLGYDIVYWNKSKSNQGMRIEPIGEYWPNETITLPEDLSKTMKSINVPVLILSYMTCTECVLCGKHQYPSTLKDKCLNKTVDFLFWTDPASIILAVFAGLIIIIVIVFAVVIKLNCSTPVVKATGGCLCFLELLSLLFNACLIFNFPGTPRDRSCVGIPLFCFGISLSLSCILANLLQIQRSWIKKCSQSIPTVIIFSGISLSLTVSWLTIFPPGVSEDEETETILYQCRMKEQHFFFASIAYNAFLGITCLLVAFKSKQLPDLYKNASLIIVSMGLFLIVWIIFLPLFLSLKGKYKHAIGAATILISSYNILGCHLAPKCYIMLFRKELNNENAVSEYIRKHNEHKSLAVVK
uniref:G-protein coupled receptor family C group 6 member A-like n=1 Tax=Kryptolebias marmoratus TaxID=37003 RepID=A0A3Q3ESD9_KRYMA